MTEGSGFRVADRVRVQKTLDAMAAGARARLDEPDLPFDIEGATILVVDDVLYTGRTLLRAAAYLAAEGAGKVACAVLCSRGSHEVPVLAEIVGMRLEVGEDHVVEVQVPPYEDDVGIVIRRRSAVEAEGE